MVREVRSDLELALDRICQQLAPDAEASIIAMGEELDAAAMADTLCDCAFVSFTPEEASAWNALTYQEKKGMCLKVARSYYD